MPLSADNRQKNLSGIVWMIASMAAFAIEDAFLKTVTKQVPVGQVLMIFGFGGLCIFAFMARRVKAPLFQAQVLTRHMLYRAIFEFFGRLFYILAIALTPISSATAILQAAPLFVVLGARIFLREKVDFKTWMAIFAGLAGVLIILRPSADDFSALSLLAVVGTLGFVGRDLFSRTAPPSLTKEVLGFYGFSTMVIAGTCCAIAANFDDCLSLACRCFCLHCTHDRHADRFNWGRHALSIFTPAVWNFNWRSCIR
jgi:drug/metabolite transporter (DMT)-like permease